MRRKALTFCAVLTLAVLPVQAQMALVPRVSSLGSSLRYSALPVTAGLNGDVINQSFQDVIRTKFAGDAARMGLDETAYFRLRSGGLGTKGMLRLRRTSRSQAIGLYAEARLGHTDGWQPVSKRNAPQHDVFRYENRRRVFAQVKTHRNGNPATYVGDMRKDSMSGRFLIPDDHYETTLQHLKQQAQKARTGGDSKSALFYGRQIERLGKIGASYGQLESEAQLAAKLAQARLISARVGWIITGVMVIPSAYMNFDAYYTGKITGNEFAYNLGKEAISLGAGIGGTALGNTLFKASPWGIGGTAAACVLIVREGFLILRYGSFEEALSQPQFWIATGGNIGGAGLGLAGAIYVGKLGTYLGSAFGTVGAGVGTTLGVIIGGGAGATIGSYGGAEATRIALDLCKPDWVYAEYDRKIDKRLDELRAAMN